MIKAEVVADSLNEFGNRITTMVVTFPRYILAELNTHRMFSRNSASSRAIPFEKMLKSVKENPYIPMAWQKDHKGMQGTEYFTEEEVAYGEFVEQYLAARDAAVEAAVGLSQGITASDGIDSGDAPSNETSIGVTKQIINRLLEPFMWHTVIVTATEWENFFALRCPKYEILGCEYRTRKQASKVSKLSFSEYSDLDWLTVNKGQADIHMMALAEAMYDAYQESQPKALKAGEWHIPFGDRINDRALTEGVMGIVCGPGEFLSKQSLQQIKQLKLKVATARCARVSYTVFGEESKPDNYEADIKLHDRLAASGHWSPFEHIGQAMSEVDYYTHLNGRSEEFGMSQTTGRVNAMWKKSENDHVFGWSGNLKGFIQYRKTFKNENHHQAPYAG